MVRTSSVFAALSVAGLLAACGVPPTPECVQYVECQNAYDAAFNIRPEDGGIDTSDFEGGGACWADLTTADTCTQHCAEAVTSLRTAANEGGATLAECAS